MQVRSAILSDQTPVCTTCKAVVKPCIVFFGEDLPERFKTLYEEDFSQCDLLVVMGTSLQVQPFAGLVYRVPQTTPRLLVGHVPTTLNPDQSLLVRPNTGFWSKCRSTQVVFLNSSCPHYPQSKSALIYLTNPFRYKA